NTRPVMLPSPTGELSNPGRELASVKNTLLAKKRACTSVVGSCRMADSNRTGTTPGASGCAASPCTSAMPSCVVALTTGGGTAGGGGSGGNTGGGSCATGGGSTWGGGLSGGGLVSGGGLLSGGG